MNLKKFRNLDSLLQGNFVKKESLVIEYHDGSVKIRFCERTHRSSRTGSWDGLKFCGSASLL
jgi:hypothetical protein